MSYFVSLGDYVTLGQQLYILINSDVVHVDIVDKTVPAFLRSLELCGLVHTSVSAEPLTPLLNLNQQLQQERGRLVLCNIGSEVAAVLRITRLDKMLEVQPDLAAALATLQRS